MVKQITAVDIRSVSPPDTRDPSLTPQTTQQYTHNLLDTGLFGDDALANLLDDYPTEDIIITTMSAGAGRNQPTSHWKMGTTEGLAGAEILTAIRRGRLWLNLKRLDKNVDAFQSLMSTMYHQLSEQFQCAAPRWQAATLLIASPTASVYYHADSIPNLLWNVRGEKDVFIYPHNNPRFASPEQLELICTGEIEEELSYQEAFESSAEVFHLQPGQAIAWPQHSPHRVVNTGGLIVSFSTEHITPQARQLVNLYRGNRMVRKLGMQPNLHDPNSFPGRTKQALALCHSAARKLLRNPPVSYDLTPKFKVDPDAELGYRDIV